MTAPVLLALLLASKADVFVIPCARQHQEKGSPVTVRAGEPAALTVVVADEEACWSGDAGTLFRGHRCGELTSSVQHSTRWVLATPVPGDYDNTRRCAPEEIAKGCHEPIRYELVELEQLRGAARVDVWDVPRLAAPGTHRLAVRIMWHGRELASPGPTAAGEGDALAPSMLEIVVRRDDTYVGFLTELLGVPFVLGPARLPGVGHQAERRLGADCVALAIYGRRRLGEPLGYVAPLVLKGWTDLVGAADSLVAPDGRVADLGRVERGDILHFGFQTAILAEDNEPHGRLDDGDLVIHTFHGVAEEVRLGQLPYRQHAVEVRRWRPMSASVNATEQR